MKITQTQGLNRQARKYQMEICVSKRGVELLLLGFTGYINGMEEENETLIRENGTWMILSTKDEILSIDGNASFFQYAFPA